MPMRTVNDVSNPNDVPVIQQPHGSLAPYSSALSSPGAERLERERVQVRDAARAEAEASLTRAEVARLLHMPTARMAELAAAARLFTYKDGRLVLYPRWQFWGPTPLPHLGAVLAAIPHGSHHRTIRIFMTSPTNSLVVAIDPLNPRVWLGRKFPPNRVIALARTLAEPT